MTEIVDERRNFGRRNGKDNYIDPLQARWAALSQQEREIVAEKRRLRHEMQIGHCEVCGVEFRRQRVTKKVCSQKCTIAAYAKRQNASFDVDLIREALPLLMAGHLLTGRSLAIVERAVLRTGAYAVVAEEVGVSRQRIQQIMKQADRMARIALAMKHAVIASSLHAVAAV